MKKKILGLALVAMSLVAFNSNAQTTCNNNKCTHTECTDGQQCRAGHDCTDGQQCGNEQKKPGTRCPHQAAFDQMNLSADQKAKIEALEQKRIEAGRQQAEARKADKQRGNAEARSARLAAKKQYLEELKAIIGTDNYVMFLENFYIQDNGMHHARMSGNRMAKVRKDVKADGQKVRPAKGERSRHSN